MSYFDYATGLTMTNKKFDELFGGPPRTSEAELTQREMDLAASIQKVTEDHSDSNSKRNCERHGRTESLSWLVVLRLTVSLMAFSCARKYLITSGFSQQLAMQVGRLVLLYLLGTCTTKKTETSLQGKINERFVSRSRVRR